jgi:dienelactone hydrolase
MRTRLLVLVLCGTAAAALAARTVSAPQSATPLRALPAGMAPDDARLGPPRDLDTHWPFDPPADADAWAARSAALRRQIRVSLGVWPWPSRTPLNTRVYRTVERDEYVVDAVAFESVPGHFVTGSLYRPKGRGGRVPAVLSPHGHWPGGRFQVVEAAEVTRALESGAERFEVAAQHPLQARAVHLARMGAMVFLFDMEGYADSQQVSEAVAHRLSDPRPQMHGRDSWGFFSPQAELHLQSIMGLQTWNIVRALDYLAARDDVDPARIGVTGASGGGTQTFILAALDTRPAAVFPAVMVSTRMQGGCTCENASYLRVGTGNVEIAALTAPRPLGMTAADDWTREVETDGFPQLRRVYEVLGAPDHVALRPFLQFGHNYNAPSRRVMYEWFNRHLALGHVEVPPERPFEPLTREEASVWQNAPSAPPAGAPHERALLQWFTTDSTRRLEALRPVDGASLGEFRNVVGGAFEAMVGRGLPPPRSVAFEVTQTTDAGAHRLALGVVRLAPHGQALPAAILSPSSSPSRGVVVWLDERGKASMFRDGAPARPVARILEAGYEVIGIDVLGSGELRGEDPPERVRLASTRAHAGYTFGYNPPLPAARTHDALAAIRLARDRAADHDVLVVASGAAAGWAAAARALAGAAVDRLVLAPGPFRFAQVDRIDHPDFFPGAAKYGDLPALVALSAPHETWLVTSAPGEFAIAGDAFRAAGKPDALRLERHGTIEDMVTAAPGRVSSKQ